MPPAVIVMVLVLVIVAVVILYARVPTSVWQVWKAKGYGGPGVVFLAFMVAATGMGLTIITTIITLTPPQLGDQAAALVTVASVTVASLASGLIAVVAVGAVIIKALPPRRPSGPRRARLPFLTLGKLIYLAIFVAIAIALLSGGLSCLVESRVYMFFVLLIFPASKLFDAALRKEKQMSSPIRSAPGAVAYIRGFAHERDRFALLSTRAKDNQELNVTYTLDRRRRGAATFEEFFEPTVRAHIGLWQCLGNLSDYLPPHGADRSYIADEKWRQEFDSLVEHSRCIPGI